MIDLYNGELLDMSKWTGFAENPQFQAISYALQYGIRMILDVADTTQTQSEIDRVPEHILDIMAVELNMYWYDPTADIEVKRKLIKHAFIVHSKMGTKMAVERVVGDFYDEAKVTEWWEYGGEPFHFRVEVASSTPLIIDDAFIEMLNKVKRLTAVFDGAATALKVETPIYTGVGQWSRITLPDIRDGGTYPLDDIDTTGHAAVGVVPPRIHLADVRDFTEYDVTTTDIKTATQGGGALLQGRIVNTPIRMGG